MTLYASEGQQPVVPSDSFVAPGARLIGGVTLHPRTSVWFNAVLRADNAPIVVGAGSQVQDLAMLHTDPNCPLILGESVSVGHQALLHGCTVGDGSLIGMQSILMNRVVIGRSCLIGAGSLLTEGMVLGDGLLILGRPARAVRPLTDAEILKIRQTADDYWARAQRLAVTLTPSIPL